MILVPMLLKALCRKFPRFIPAGVFNIPLSGCLKQNNKTNYPYIKVSENLSICTEYSCKPLNRYGSSLQCSFSKVKGRYIAIWGEGLTNLLRKIAKNRKNIKHRLAEYFWQTADLNID